MISLITWSAARFLAASCSRVSSGECARVWIMGPPEPLLRDYDSRVAGVAVQLACLVKMHFSVPGPTRI